MASFLSGENHKRQALAAESRPHVLKLRAELATLSTKQVRSRAVAAGVMLTPAPRDPRTCAEMANLILAAEEEERKKQALAEKQAALEEELKQLQKWHDCGLITEVVWQEWQRSLHGDKARGSDLPGKARGMLGP